MKVPPVLILIPALLLAGCFDSLSDASHETEWSLDQQSYTLGGIGAFSEMVGAGVKKLALSAPLDPQAMDALLPHAQRIASEHGVGLYRETDFLVTDLFSAALTDGKHVLLICAEDTHQEYLELKARKQSLIDSGQYVGDARVDVARSFGELLSYTDEKINSLLAAEDNSPTP